MVYQQLGINAKQFVQQLVIAQRLPRHIAHRIHAMSCKFARYAFAYPPEFGYRLVVPQFAAIAHLI